MSKVINIQDLEYTNLYKELIHRGPGDFDALTANLKTICDEAADRSKLVPTFFREYTLHDKSYFLRVAELMYY